MKKQLFTLALLLAGAIANAQISKGDIQINGSFNYSDISNSGVDFKSFGLTPSIGYLLQDNISLGATMAYTSSTFQVLSQGTGNIEDRDRSEFNYGVFARFYKKPADNFYLFLQPSFQLISGERQDFNGDNIDTNGFQTGLTAGMSYFISSKFAVELTAGNIGYSSTTNDNAGAGIKVKDKSFSASLDFANVGFGLSYFIR